MEEQSGTVPGGIEQQAQAGAQHQVVAFADQDAGWEAGMNAQPDPTFRLCDAPDASLGAFLERPIRQSAQSWLVGQPFFYKFNPWTAFCSDPAVRDKIRNYNCLRMNLHVKFVVSGTRFHYGRALACYNPFTLNDKVTVTRNFFSQDLIQASQKPHVFLNPTKNSGGELHLPFFWNRNYFHVPNNSWSGAGEVIIKSFQNLLHANNGTDPVTVSIFIWASDVTLAIPTSTDIAASPVVLTSQSGRMKMGEADEYGDGIISKPAAAVANACGFFAQIPSIRPYALATQMAAGAVGNIAKIFGMSRPVNISAINPMKPSPCGNLANVDAPDTVMRLTMDSKAEVTVDSRVVGLDGSDEMGIVDYACRESYLTQITWDPSKPIDGLLFNSYVRPGLWDVLGDEIHLTPMAHIGTAFEWWQGSIKFRFQVVKSDFHKGRLLFRWDPNYNSSVVRYNTVYSRVVDIAEMEDFEIIIGWGQPEPFQRNPAPIVSMQCFSATQRLGYESIYSNGILEVSVLNDLVAPGPEKPVFLNVFVSACPDLKLLGPTEENMANLHLFRAGLDRRGDITSDEQGGPDPDCVTLLDSQSGVMPLTENTTVVDKPTDTRDSLHIGPTGTPADPTYLVFYGDPPSSLRSLLKRYSHTHVWYPVRPTTNESFSVNFLTTKNMPYFTGFDPAGVDRTTGGRAASLGTTCFINWFIPCYAAMRGAFRRKYCFHGFSPQTVSVVRRPTLITGNGGWTTATWPINFGHNTVQGNLSFDYSQRVGNGAAATNTGVNDTIEVELPFYWAERMASARAISAQNLQTNSHEVRVMTANSNLNRSDVLSIIHEYSAVGDDFSLHFFTGVPIMYSYVARGNE